MKAPVGLLHQFLEQSAAVYPAKTALVQGNVRVTYECLNRYANAFANFLLEKKIRPGDRVILACENGFEYVVCYYGTMKAGCTAVPVHPDTPADLLLRIFNSLGPFCTVASPRSEKAAVTAGITEGPGLLLMTGSSGTALAVSHNLFECIQGFSEENPAIDCDQNSLSSIIYTSGSTGMPRGVMLSHNNIVSNTCAIGERLKLDCNDIQMVVLPFSYVMGASLLNTHIAAGGTVVINNSFMYTAAVLNQMVDERVTGFSGVPSTYIHLLYRSPLAAYREKLGALRYCSQAGGHLPDRIKTELRKVLPAHTALYIMYGATEASARLTILDPERFSDKMGSIGTPISGVTLQVINEKNGEAAANETGELVASGPNIMKGYWDNEAATRNVLDDKGYHTGDFGYRDTDGFFYVTGRKDLQLKVRGYRINPQEIEDALIATGKVMEAVVIGIDDHLSETHLVACVSPMDKSCSSDLIRKILAGILPKYKQPDTIILLSALPKSVHGKTDRNACRRLAFIPGC